MKRVPAYEINCRACSYEATILDSIEAESGQLKDGCHCPKCGAWQSLPMSYNEISRRVA